MIFPHRVRLTVALIIPILVLGAITIKHTRHHHQGQEVTLPITGFDPRDLLSGHYLTYRLNYGVEPLCAKYSGPASVCLTPNKNFQPTAQANNCDLFISGQCENKRFTAGIERFYIPENLAAPLEKAVINQQGSVLLSVQKDGQAQVKNLYIDGQLWRKFIK